MSEIDGERDFERLLASFLRDELGPAGLACPAPGVAAAYFEGKLGQREAGEFERHLAGCAGCQAQIAALVRLEAATAEPSETEVRAPVTAPVVTPEPSAPPAAQNVGAPESSPPPAPKKVVEEKAPERVPPPARVLVDETRPLFEASIAKEAHPEKPKEKPAREKATEAAAEQKRPIEGTMPFKPGERRSSWRWVGPVALAATVVLAVSFTLRYAPMIEEATRKAREADVVPPAKAPTSAPAPSADVDRDADRAQRKDEGKALDRLWQEPQPARPDPASPLPPPSQPSAGLVAAPPAHEQPLVPPPAPAQPQAAAPSLPPARTEARVPSPPPARAQAPLPTPPSAPQAKAGGRAAETFALNAAPQQEGKKEDARRALMERTAITAATAATPQPRIERPRNTGPVVVVARTNLDAAWRLSGNGIERSDDAGKTWRPQMSFTGAALFAGSAPSAEICWVAGQGGTVLRSKDGEHWERLLSPTHEDLVQVTAWNVSSATIKTVSGARFSTNDGGQTWSQL